jgi:hypothetical protein
LGELATGLLSLEESLTRVAQFAVRAIPGAEGAGLTLLEENRSDTIVATADFVTQVDDIQYSLGQGPCISAAADQQTVMSGSWAVTNAGHSSDLRSPAWACTAWCPCRW